MHPVIISGHQKPCGETTPNINFDNKSLKLTSSGNLCKDGCGFKVSIITLHQQDLIIWQLLFGDDARQFFPDT